MWYDAARLMQGSVTAMQTMIHHTTIVTADDAWRSTQRWPNVVHNSAMDEVKAPQEV